ncbi:MAG: hypothetical protein ACUVR0_09350 [Candidatus Aminicenantales bacterium]
MFKRLKALRHWLILMVPAIWLSLIASMQVKLKFTAFRITKPLLKFLWIAFLIVIYSFIPLSAEGWKFKVGITQHDFSLKDLESPLDFWNSTIRSVMINKNKDYGLNLPLPKEMEGISKSQGLYLSLERRIFSFIFIGLGGKFEHASYTDSDRLEGIDETGGGYEVFYNWNDSMDCISPFLQLSFYPLELKNFEGGFYLRSLLNLSRLSVKYSFKLHLTDEEGSVTRAQAEESSSLESDVFFPSLEAGASLAMKYKFISLTGFVGYRSGKRSPLEGDFKYDHVSWSGWHPREEEHIEGSGKVWVGESYVEMGGYSYWPKTIIVSKEKPDPSILRNAREAELSLAGAFFGIALTFHF